MVGRVEKQLGIALLDEGHTRRRGGHHRTVVAKDGKELVTEILGLLHKTGVEGKTAATGLFWVVADLDTGLLQHLDGIDRRLGVELVDETRNKKVDNHGSLSLKLLKIAQK